MMRWTRICVIAGVAARIACVLAGPGAVRTDALAYRAMAHGTTIGGASPWMPGWPVWMSIFYRAGLGDRAIVFGNALLGIATIALAAAIARELGRDAHMTAAITAIVPSLATMPRLLVSENLALPLFALSTLLLVRASRAKSVEAWVMFAVSAALATYVREACIAVVFAGLVVAALVNRSLSSAIVIAGVVAVALAPWVTSHHGLTTSDSRALCIGLGDGATGGYRAVSSNCEIHLGKLVTLAPAKLARLFAWDDWTCDDFFRTRTSSRGMRVFCNISWWLLLVSATIGAIKKPSYVLFAAIGAVALVTVVTFGVGRFHAPLVPLLCVLALGAAVPRRWAGPTPRRRRDGACYRRRS